MEQVHDEKKDIAYYRNAIPEAVIEFYEGQGIEQKDIINQAGNTWSAAMRYANRLCVNRDDLLEHYRVSEYGLHSKKYNEELVGGICDIYLEICDMFDKIPSAWAFSLLSGIDRNTLEMWRNSYGREVSPGRVNIMKKVSNAREMSLANRISDGKRNPVGCIACLNFEFAWNTAHIVEERHDRPLTLAELPTFDAVSGSFIGGVQKAQELPVKGSDNVLFSVDGLPILRVEEVKNEV